MIKDLIRKLLSLFRRRPPSETLSPGIGSYQRKRIFLERAWKERREELGL